MAVYEALLLNTVVPQIQAAQTGDSYVMVVNATTPALRITQTGTGDSILVEDAANPDSSPFVVTAAGDVGIGTTNPGSYLSGTAKLVAYANANSQNNILVRNDSNGASSSSAIALNAAGNTWGIEIGSSAKNGNALTFQLDYGGTNSEKMRLDTSGNLGLGVTPSAWSGVTALQVGSGAALFDFGSSNVVLGSNVYFDGTSNKYINTDYATYYQQNNGVHIWATAASGTAGATTSITSGSAYSVTTLGSTTLGQWQAYFSALGSIPSIGQTVTATATGTLAGGATVTQIAVFTQAMTLDASGRLGVGETNPAAVIHANAAGGGSIRASRSTVSSEYIQMDHDGSDGSLRVSGAYAMLFHTNSSERARITSGGYFKASNSGAYLNSTATYHEINQTANDNILFIRSTDANYSVDGVQLRFNRNTTNNTFYALSYYNDAAAAYKFRVADSGDVTNTNGTYGTISDAKMKTDIVDAGSQWSDIKALRFRKFKMKDDPSGLVQLGVVAQEVELTSPGLVDEHPDMEMVEVTDDEGNVTQTQQPTGTTTKSVKTSVLLMKAAVALQEAMARIETLEAEVAALKGA